MDWAARDGPPVDVLDVRLCLGDQRLERFQPARIWGPECVAAVLSGLDHDPLGMLGVGATTDEHAIAQIAEREIDDRKNCLAVVCGHVM